MLVCLRVGVFVRGFCGFNCVYACILTINKLQKNNVQNSRGASDYGTSMVHTSSINLSGMAINSDIDMTCTTEKSVNESFEPEKADNFEHMFHPQNVCSETDDESDSAKQEKPLSQKLGEC